MNCELAQERMVTAAYGELSDELAHELEQHVAGCAACQNERTQTFALKVLADLHPVAEPGPNLVARARLRLDETLDLLPPKRWYERLGERILANFATLQSAPTAALLLLIAGGGAGVLGGYEYAQGRAAQAATSAQAASLAVQKLPPEAAAPELANVAAVSG